MHLKIILKASQLRESHCNQGEKIRKKEAKAPVETSESFLYCLKKTINFHQLSKLELIYLIKTEENLFKVNEKISHECKELDT